MTYYGRLISDALLQHAIRTSRPRRAEQGRPAHAPSPQPGKIPLKDTPYKRWRRRKMWEHDRRCHWCRCVTVLVDRSPDNKIPKRDDEATIDHLDPRYSPERGKHSGEIRWVLACWKCNSLRNDEFQRSVPIQTRWERSGQIVGIAKRSGALNEVSE